MPAARLYSRLFSRRREVAPPLQISSADSARDVDAVFSLDVDTSRKLAVVAHTRLKQNVAVSVCVVYPDSRIGVAALYNHAVADRSVSSAAVNGDRPTRVTVLSLGIAGPLVAAMFFTDDIAKIGTVMGEIDGILNQPELVRPERKCDLQNLDIALENVHFAYEEKEVLKGIDLTIPQGKITAFVGPSGSGKSTIAKLIASFWDVTGGLITIGDKSVKEISNDQLNDLISYVSQDNYLFNDTVRNNIRMGKPEASDSEVEQIAKDSGCHEFIMNLEHGYETVVGGAGGHLSGGERQRIAIARAMLKNAPIVILDEATSYTDPENEAVIQEAISRLTKGKTLIVIAHRLSTITDSDQIVVVKDGTIQAKGTHEELLKECSLYHTMWTAHMDAKEVKTA